jgi:2'-hydroxyisoflavone reductase
LAGRRFDACIDPSGYLPGQLEISGRALKDVVDRYVFISSISVYATPTENLDESGKLCQLPEGVDKTTYDEKYYGAFKVLCEQAIDEAMPGRVLHVRSGLIVGPYDPTNRFTYWPVRVAKGGKMLAPSGPDFPVQMIHGSDQARWILQMVQSDQMGVFNLTSDNGTYTLGEVIETARSLTGSDAEPVWIPSDYLLEKEVSPWMGLPLWLPDESLNMSRVSTRKAVESGLKLMPLKDIIQTTLEWYRDEPEREWPAGLPVEQERAVILAWKSRS